MVPGDTRVGNPQVLIPLAPDRERSVVEINGLLIVPLHVDEDGEKPRTRGRNRARYGLKGHLALFTLLNVSKKDRSNSRPNGANLAFPEADDRGARGNEARLRQPHDSGPRTPPPPCHD